MQVNLSYTKVTPPEDTFGIPTVHVVRANGKAFASIDDLWPFTIRIAVVARSKQRGITWKWLTLNPEVGSVELAKHYLQENLFGLMKTFDIHYHQD